MFASPRRAVPSGSKSSLAVYLDSERNWQSPHLLPIISEAGLERARNSKKHVHDNNDLLEFMGDRVVNFACALMAEKIKYSPDHQIWVGRALCNNDTLGRLGYQLNLDKSAQLDLYDSLQIRGWGPYQRISPPKPFADLFEAYVGAVFDENGWDFTFEWLKTLYRPLLYAASDDFFHTNPKIPAHWYGPDLAPEESFYQATLLEYLESKGNFLAESAQETLDALPLSSLFMFSPAGNLGNDCDKVEVATHLIKLWISVITLDIDPKLKDATGRAAHFLSTITRAVASDWTLGHLGSLLALSSYFESTDPDFNCNRRLGREHLSHEIPYRTKLSFVLKAAIGWYYLKDSEKAEKWGIIWFTPMVHKAHTILVNDRRYQPSMLSAGVSRVLSYEIVTGPPSPSAIVQPVVISRDSSEERDDDPKDGDSSSESDSVDKLERDDQKNGGSNSEHDANSLVDTLQKLDIDTPAPTQISITASSKGPTMPGDTLVKKSQKTIVIKLSNASSRQFSSSLGSIIDGLKVPTDVPSTSSLAAPKPILDERIRQSDDPTSLTSQLENLAIEPAHATDAITVKHSKWKPIRSVPDVLDAAPDVSTQEPASPKSTTPLATGSLDPNIPDTPSWPRKFARKGFEIEGRGR